MNLPNKLTLLRILMIPVFLATVYIPAIPHNFLWAFAVFAAASLTDLLDGRIARKRSLITDFGILMDPLADKLLVMAAMVCFVHLGLVHGVIVVVILAREFLVTSIRLVAAGKGEVIAADKWGKIKTVSQMIWILLGLVTLWMSSAHYTGASWRLPALAEIFLARCYLIFALLVLLSTVVSGANYVRKNRKLFQDA